MRHVAIALAVFLGASCNVRETVSGPTFLPGHEPEIGERRWQAVAELTDEFEGKKLDSEKWQAEPVGNGWTWIGRPPGLFHERIVRVADGELQVTVSPLPSPVMRKGRTYLYQGAIVRSIHPGHAGWYFETRMKANATAMSSTFWLMTQRRGLEKLELDIQECIGRTSERTASWAKTWDSVFHGNAIHRKTKENPKPVQVQGSIPTPTKNHERFYIYGCWWKSPTEVLFYLDGEYAFSITPPVEFDVPSWLQMAIETYDWNPVPEDGGLVASGTPDQRTTRYDWIRVWKLE